VYQTADTIKALTPELAIIVPVHNGARTLRACLEALVSAPGPTRELIVVDDGSIDGSADIAAAMDVRIIRHRNTLGDGAARNSGVKQTTAAVLAFVDSDVVIHPDALQRISEFMSTEPGYAAVFGSYDAKPSDPGFVSQYRNLLHHFTHQRGNSEAETFWTGLGAMRRSVFQSAGGFRSDCRPIADVALGLQLSDAGFRIRLDQELLGTHLKAWTLRTMVVTDIFMRAAPWSEIILTRGRFSNDLSTSVINRLGVAFAIATVAFASLATMIPVFVALAKLSLLVGFLANTPVFKQFWKERGAIFTLGVVPLHFVHQLCSGIGFALALKRRFLGAVTPLRDGLASLEQPADPSVARATQAPIGAGAGHRS